MIKTIFKLCFVSFFLFGLWNLMLGYFPFLLFFLFVFLIIFLSLMSLKAMRHTDVLVSTDKHFVERQDNIYFTFQRQDSLHIHCGQIIIEYKVIDVFEQCIFHRQVTILDEVAMDVITLPHCGFYTIQIEQIRCYDLLQCFFHRCVSHQNISLYVLPKYKKTNLQLLDTFQEHPDAIDYATHHGGDDYSEIYEVRKYHENDPLRHIHWKASLKKNELLVKVGSQPIVKRIVLAMLYHQNDDYSDKQFDVFFSLCSDLLRKQIPFEILVPQCHDVLSHNEYIESVEHLREVLQKIMKTPIERFDNIPKNQMIYMIKGENIEVYQS
jgi:hypothetical protein